MYTYFRGSKVVKITLVREVAKPSKVPLFRWPKMGLKELPTATCCTKLFSYFYVVISLSWQQFSSDTLNTDLTTMMNYLFPPTGKEGDDVIWVETFSNFLRPLQLARSTLHEFLKRRNLGAAHLPSAPREKSIINLTKEQAAHVYGWKSLKALLLRAPLCGANNRISWHINMETKNI